MFGVLFVKKVTSTFWALTTLVSGSFVGIVSGIYAIFFNQEYVWFPIILSFSTSSIVFLIGTLLSRNKE